MDTREQLLDIMSSYLRMIKRDGCEYSEIVLDNIAKSIQYVLEKNNYRELSDEFNFKSNINPFGILYHAKRKENCYEVSCDSEYKYYYTVKEMMRRISNGDYVIV